MKRYRILTDGDRFRVQRHLCFGPFRIWRYAKFIEINDSYPKVVRRVVEFDDFQEADAYVQQKLKTETPKRRRWRPVQKYEERKEQPRIPEPVLALLNRSPSE